MKNMLRTWLCALAFASFAIAAPVAQTQKSLPMAPLQEEWQAVSGEWRTTGQRPAAGWYLRSQRQYDIGTFSLAIRKAVAEDLVFIYLKDWQICLRPDSITVRYAGLMTANFRGTTLGRPWDLYWYTATRPQRGAGLDHALCHAGWGRGVPALLRRDLHSGCGAAVPQKAFHAPPGHADAAGNRCV